MGNNPKVFYDRETEVVRTANRNAMEAASNGDNGCVWRGRYLPLIILTILFAGVLAALIGISVLLAQTKDKLETCNLNTVPTTPATVVTTESSVAPTTPPLLTGSLRLPRVAINGTWTNLVDPISYELFLKIHVPYDDEDTISDPFTTKGNWVAIRLKTQENGLRRLTLHARHEVPANSRSGHLKRFLRENVTVSKVAGGDVIVVDSLEYLTNEQVVVNLVEGLVADQEYVLKIEFDGVIAQDSQGLYRSQYMRGGKLRNLITSQLHAYKARRVFPCFDEPGYRSTFRTTLQYPRLFSLTRTNGDAESSVSSSDNLWTTTTYRTSPRMPVYLNAFLVSTDDFKMHSPEVTANDYLPSGADEITFPVNVFGNSELIEGSNGRKDGLFAAEHGRNVIETLTTRFEQPYGLTKLDQVGVPDFVHNAMENWGLVLYREASLMYQPKVSTADQKRAVASLVGHELSHMIFGNLLTCEWWSDSWLNEGFARFMEFEMLVWTKSSWNVRPMFNYWVVRDALAQDAHSATHALSDSSVQTPAEIDGMFDTITYAKGASILHMIKGIMGETPFFNALKAYVQKYKGQSVRPEHFLSELDTVEAAAADVKKLSDHLKGWIEQKGYPVVKITRNYDFNAAAEDISFTQSRFLLPVWNGSSTSVHSATEKWDIPLTLTNGAIIKDPAEWADVHVATNTPCWVTSAAGATEKLSAACLAILSERPQVPGNDTMGSNYIVANVQQYGFYRVNYDLTNWIRIIRAPVPSGTTVNILNDVATRGQLFDDSFNLARADLMEGVEQYDVPLRLVNRYLPGEVAYGPLASATDNIRFIDQMLRGSPNYRRFALYMQTLAAALYNARPDIWSTDWVDTTTAETAGTESSYGELMFNNLIIETACFYEVPECLAEAERRLGVWVGRGPSAAFAPDERLSTENLIQTKSLVLCYGLRDGKPAYWQFMKELLVLPGTITSSKLILLRGMACSRDESHLQELLMMATDTTIVRSQDVNAVFGYLTKFHQSHILTWDFIQREWSSGKLTNRANLVTTFGGGLTNQWRLEQLKVLFEIAKDGKKDRYSGGWRLY
ncbi:Aminopeptidase N [Hypsibius exemplaris]|uniref:Aminopeptidase N n=1 Tax=Hypsibius exemplaris TaxID=2072580 RepID=A0A9X6NJL6_HYPEX|nr:Aminopeptidase N [Hypsibius exemplaris]